MQTNIEPPAMPAEANDSRTASDEAVVCKELLDISERLKTQDNRITQNPMFCVQIKRRDVGYDSANEQTIYDDDPDFKEPEGDEWDEFGYRDRWETVMVAFTEEGCLEYLRLNGHNHRGETRIYVESFRRCPEMIAIRASLMANDGGQQPHP